MKQLSILHVNKFHYLKGGSEVVYFQTANELEAHGHKSLFFSMHHPDNFPCETSEYFVPYIDFNKSKGTISYLKGGSRVLYYMKARKLLSKLLDKHHVDIAHLHNIHHQLSPSIIYEFKKRKIPIVMTLHDYKMVCASYNLLVQERPCEVCVRGNYYKAIKHRCVKDSFAKSLLSAVEMYLHHKILDMYGNIDIFIAPSLFLKNKLVEMGFLKEIVYLPNFVSIEKFSEFNRKFMQKTREDSIVYFGRLTRGKGLFTLLETARILSLENNSDKFEIKIIGEGPLREDLLKAAREKSISNVRFLGFMKGESLFQEIKNSLAVVLPSEWYENNPMAIIEAFALGKPVIGSRIAGIPELVRDNETGLTFEPENPVDLSLKIKKLRNNPDEAEEMGKKASLFVARELNPGKYYQKLIAVYDHAMYIRESKMKAV